MFSAIRNTSAAFHSLTVAVAVVMSPLLAAAADPAGEAKPFLATYCVRCHNAKTAEGKFRADDLPDDVADPGFSVRWGMALERLNSGEMPPGRSKQPTPDARAQAVETIAGRLRDAEAAQAGAAGRVRFARLSRQEYANTVRDLLGVTYVPTDPGGLPEDPNWRGFERIGSVLSLSPAHVERYLSAAEQALDQALPSAPPPKFRQVWDAVPLLTGNGDQPSAMHGWPAGVRTVIPPNNNSRAGPNSNIGFGGLPAAGEYRARVKLSGFHPPGGDAPHLMVYAINLDRVLHEQDVEAPEDKPTVIEFTAQLPAGEHNISIWNTNPGPSVYEQGTRGTHAHKFFTLKQGRFATQRKLTDDDGVPLVPFLIVDDVVWEGPLHDPAAAARLLGDGRQDATHARAAVARFAERAFRRPLRAGEADRYAVVAERALAAGVPFRDAVKAGLAAVLCAKDFIYLVEGDAAGGRAALTDWELASRLSYFVWGTMPDDRLLGHARVGRLSRPDVLKSELARLLADPRTAAPGGLADAFPRQWLHLRDVGKFPPDKKLYPDYDDSLQKAMIAEPVAFFGRVLTENLGLREFLDSDWTMGNATLARYYGIPGVVDSHLRKVPLPPELKAKRGGLLTTAAVLSLTSDGTRHRPVHRGKWVLEAVFNTSPPPPPPNAGDIPTTPAGQPKATVRMKLEAHRSNAACAACHRRIDPLGMAFDNYDAIGRWRTTEVVTDGAGANPAVDASGVLADGRSFAGPAEFKKLLAADLDRFAVAFADKLATYALRRPAGYGDRPAVLAIAARAKPGGSKLQDLIESLVLSDLFRTR